MVLIKAEDKQFKDSVLCMWWEGAHRSCKDPKMPKDFSERSDPSKSQLSDSAI